MHTNEKIESATLTAIDAVIQQLGPEPIDPSNPDYPFVFVLVTAMLEGTNTDRIASVTGYSLEFIGDIESRMVASELWKADGSDYGDWFHPETGIFAFVMDLMVAKGLLARTPQKRNGKYLYTLVESPDLNLNRNLNLN